MCLWQCGVCSTLHRSVTTTQLYLARLPLRNIRPMDRKICCWRTVLGAKRVGEMVMERVAVMMVMATCALWDVSALHFSGTDLLNTSTLCSQEVSFSGQVDAGKLRARFDDII
jgi:hypothetical protein